MKHDLIRDAEARRPPSVHLTVRWCDMGIWRRRGAYDTQGFADCQIKLDETPAGVPNVQG